MSKDVVLRSLFFTCLLLFFFVRSASAQFEDEAAVSEFGSSRIKVGDEEYGYAVTAAKWNTLTVRVCWETLDPKYQRDREYVQIAIAESWQRHSKLKFTGWGQCPDNFAGIRIATPDDPRIVPQTRQIGRRISGMKNGMILNFNYQVNFPSCLKRADGQEFCTRGIAMHEFGHAISLDHEHNRADRALDCVKNKTLVTDARPLTPYDPDSVMNYCNVDWKSGLSAMDIDTVQALYGGP